MPDDRSKENKRRSSGHPSGPNADALESPPRRSIKKTSFKKPPGPDLPSKETFCFRRPCDRPAAARPCGVAVRNPALSVYRVRFPPSIISGGGNTHGDTGYIHREGNSYFFSSEKAARTLNMAKLCLSICARGWWLHGAASCGGISCFPRVLRSESGMRLTY